MPIYEFKCKDCGEKFEISMSFNGTVSEINCPNCKSKNLQKTFGNPNIIYKGSGWGKEKKHE